VVLAAITAYLQLGTQAVRRAGRLGDPAEIESRSNWPSAAPARGSPVAATSAPAEPHRIDSRMRARLPSKSSAHWSRLHVASFTSVIAELSLAQMQRFAVELPARLQTSAPKDD